MPDRPHPGEAVGIELLFNLTKSRVFTVLPTVNQMNWSQMELGLPVPTGIVTWRLFDSSTDTNRCSISKSSHGNETAPFVFVPSLSHSRVVGTSSVTNSKFCATSSVEIQISVPTTDGAR